MITTRLRAPPFWTVGALLLMGLLLAACAPAATPEPTEVPAAPIEVVVPPTAVPPEPTPLPDQSAFHDAWATGAHGNTYGLGKGPNTYCSRCHSPQNWDPSTRVDRPPNCVTCKMPMDEEVRNASTMEFVEEADWVGINCETCHRVDENGITDGRLAWLDVVSNTYEAINTPNEMCQKCHLTTAGVRATGGSGVTHEIVLGGSAHRNWAGEMPRSERPQYCSDCHDPHTLAPSACEDCHMDIRTSDTHMGGLNSIMLDKVTCMACHDADEMEVGPHPEPEMGGMFTTLVSSVSRSGEPTTEYVKSHSIQWQVACDRCHFAENPWELSHLTADGEVPEPETETESG